MRSEVGYRPELDGLRAVAVLLVVLNHAGVPHLGGGYIGVDVFFVLSGFLITSIIRREIDAGTFRIRRFFERRVRRLLPALYVMLAFVTAAAFLFLIDQDRADYFRTLTSVVTYWSNVRFFLDTGYFDIQAQYKPLLHTWSLGIEEQFYVFFPFVVTGLQRFRKSTQYRVLAVLAVSSFILMMQVATKDAFYLLQSRAWELLTGSLLAMWSAKMGLDGSRQLTLRRWTSLAASFSIFLIVISAVLIDKEAPWPSYLTAVPVFATAVLIVSANQDNVVGRLLAMRPLVAVGLWSYSIYLWHYPLFAFVRYRTVGPVGPNTSALLIALSLSLGWISWRFVESPFRTDGLIRSKALWSFAFGGCIVFVSLGMVNSGNANRPGSVDIALGDADKSPVVLIGDSHADHLVFGLVPHVGDQLAVEASAGCVPLWRVDRFDARFRRGDCATFVTGALDSAISSRSVRVVVLASMGPVYVTGETFRGFDPARVTEDGLVSLDDPQESNRWMVLETGLRETFHRLQRAGKQSVYVIDVPELGIEPQHCSPQRQFECRNLREEIDVRGLRYRNLVIEVAREFPSVTVFDPTTLFCDSKVCDGVRAGERLYRDVDHLSEAGSRMVGNELGPLMLKILGDV